MKTIGLYVSKMKGEFEYKRKAEIVVWAVVLFAVVPILLIQLEGNNKIGTGTCVLLIAAGVAFFFIVTALRKFGTGTYEATDSELVISKGGRKSHLPYADIMKAHAEIFSAGKKHGGINYRMEMVVTMKNGGIVRLFDFHLPDNEAQNPRDCNEVFETHRFSELDKLLNAKIGKQ